MAVQALKESAASSTSKEHDFSLAGKSFVIAIHADSWSAGTRSSHLLREAENTSHCAEFAPILDFSKISCKFPVGLGPLSAREHGHR